MAEAARRRATYQDVLDAPSHVIAEVIAGTLYTHPRPRPRYARASSRIGALLDGPFDRGVDGPGGWILLDEPELHLGAGPDILVPDLGGWRRETLPEFPDEAFIDIRPDWVCEVLSRSTEPLDRADKMPVYQREGVAHVWLIDPELQTLEVFRLDGASYRLMRIWKGEERCRAEPFDAMDLDLTQLWAW